MANAEQLALIDKGQFGTRRSLGGARRAARRRGSFRRTHATDRGTQARPKWETEKGCPRL